MVGDRGRVVVGLADLEQERVGVDGLTVDGRADEQFAGAGDGLQRDEEVVEQDVVGGERRDLGHRGVELPSGLEQVGGARTELLGERGFETALDVGVAATAVGQPRVEVLQRAGVAAEHPPDLFDLCVVELAVQRGQRPDELARLRG